MKEKTMFTYPEGSIM